MCFEEITSVAEIRVRHQQWDSAIGVQPCADPECTVQGELRAEPVDEPAVTMA